MFSFENGADLGLASHYPFSAPGSQGRQADEGLARAEARLRLDLSQARPMVTPHYAEDLYAHGQSAGKPVFGFCTQPAANHMVRGPLVAGFGE